MVNGQSLLVFHAVPEESADSLLAKARALPRVPGVYLLRDYAGVVLYVGKARLLPDRVSAYFVPKADHGPRKQPMLALISDFDTVPCEGEWEALLMEARLIKDLKPKFNRMLLDDKSFPYLVVTTRDEFPGVYITRDPESEATRGGRVFGPFVSGGSLRRAVEMLQRVFKYRTCELTIRADDPTNSRFRPCLLHAIGQCSAPCANRISRDAYGEDIGRFLRFIVSKRSAMKRELTQEMTLAADGQQFERAAVLRDQIEAIERLDDREQRGDLAEYEWQPEVTSLIEDPVKGLRSLQRALGHPAQIRCIEAIDIAHLGGNETVGSKVCFMDGRPFRDGYRRYRVRSVTNNDVMAIREVVSRRYRDAGEGKELFPDLIIIDGGSAQLSAAMDAFGELGQTPPMVIGLAKREELIYTVGCLEPIRLGRENPGLRLCQAVRDEAHRFAQHYHHILRSKRVIGEPP
ncbi:MAG: excinuclease ABC subunit UvrC [Phycisphaerales bacterium]|nr:excinuclease ABC subunit UvrC [Phycisphaerales bacterium]